MSEYRVYLLTNRSLLIGFVLTVVNMMHSSKKIFEMFTRQRLIFFVLVMVILSLPWNAYLTKVFAQPPAVKAGIKEFNFMASSATTHVIDPDRKILMAAFGYFVADQHEIGLDLAYSSSKFTGEKERAILPHLFYAFYTSTGSIEGKSFLPSIGAKVGIGKMDRGDDGNIVIISYGLYGGMKFFIIPGAAFTVQPSYSFQIRRSNSSVDNVEGFGIDLGISLFLM